MSAMVNDGVDGDDEYDMEYEFNAGFPSEWASEGQERRLCWC